VFSGIDALRTSADLQRRVHDLVPTGIEKRLSSGVQRLLG
jgi:hypothetical protein